MPADSAALPHPALLVPDWPAPPGVRALCTTRLSGISEGAWASLNLGDHVGDAPQAVAVNRQRLAATLGTRPVFLRQVHGTDVLALAATTPDGAEADAATATAPGLACTILVADCLPVLLCDAAGSRVAAAHAGWRGLAAGVLEQTFKHFRPPGQSQSAWAASNVIAWLGPCIGPQAFEVGPEVKAAFEAQDAAAAAHFRPHAPGKWLADLPGLARQRLAALGVRQVFGNDGGAPWCTVGNPSRFFSHRRDAGRSGRLAACIWLAGG